MKKLLLAISFIVVFACLFTVLAFADEISVTEIKSEAYGTVYQLSSDPGLDEAEKYVSTLNNITDSGKDTESLSILTDGTYFYVFPSSYIVYELSNGKFEYYVGTDTQPGINQALAEWQNNEGTALPTFELTGSWGSRNLVSLIRFEVTSDVKYFDANHCLLRATNLKEVRFLEGHTVCGGMFNTAPSLETVIGLENTTGFNGSTHFFRGCTKLTTVTLPSGLTSIGKETFYNCSSLVTIGNWEEATKDITSIGQEAFYGCSSIVSLKLADSITSIGQKCFYGCKSLSEFNVPSSLVTLGNATFQNCSSLERLEFPPTTTSFGQDCFHACSSLKYINVPRDCTYVGNYTFAGCSALEEIDMTKAESLTSWGSNNAWGNVTELVFPEGFESIKGISSGKVTKIVFPSSTTSIGVLQCSSLKEFVVPEGITQMNDKFFDYCGSLETVTIPMGVTYISTSNNGAFYGSSKNVKNIIFTGKADYEILETIKTVLPNAAITFVSHCDVYYDGAHVETNEVIKFVNIDGTNGEKFLSYANVCVDCTRCLETRVVKSVDPLFTNKGWSFDEENTSALTQSFTLNKDVLDFYKESFGISDFGIVGAVHTYQKNGEEVVNSDGALLTLGENGLTSNSGAISASFLGTDFEIFKLKVTGLSGDNAKAKIFISAYVVANGEINYLSNGQAYVGVAQNSTSVEALLTNGEE